MPKAVCLITEDKDHPHPQFAQGLRNAGFEVTTSFSGPMGPGDVLLSWNRMGIRHGIATAFEKAGLKVIIAENAWIGRTPDNRKLYSLCLNHHNGAGHWKVGHGDRLASMGFHVKPWRQEGRHIVILASRGIGEPGIAQQRGWPDETMVRLKTLTDRPIVMRRHPGDSHADIGTDIEGAHAVVTWASGAGVKAIAAGIPAFYCLNGWVGAPAARFGLEGLEHPFLGDRRPMFERLSWAQWSAEEIATGGPIRWLLT